MTLSFDTARCAGQEIPFGTSYDHPECRSCARAKQTEHHPYRQPWCGPIKFDGTCPFKIEDETE